MNGSTAIGRIFGVPLRLHWSAPLLVAILGWGLAARTLPAWSPGRSPLVYTVGGLVGAVLLLGSLLLHEAAHALTARRAGIEVQDVTVWALGGLTRMGPPGSARVLLAVSSSGPLTSLLLGGVGLGAGFGLQAVFGATLAVDLLLWLGTANILLGVFNLLPAAPLDGGRVLQALLWRRDGDRERAEQTAGRSGQTIGLVLVGLGAVLFLRGGAGGLWLMLIGFFVWISAGAEVRHAELSAALRGVRTAQVMSSPVDTGPDWLPVDRFVEEVAARRHHSALPLLAFDGRPSGIVTLRQLASVPAARRAELKVRDVATPLSSCATAAPDEEIVQALGRLRPGGSARILVVDGDRLVGIVTGHDITRVMQQHVLRGPGAPASGALR